VSILVVGLSHHSAPVAVLERVVVTGDDMVKLLHDVHASPHVTEAVVVSTCNRVEVYAEVDKFHGGVSSISELLARYSGVPLEELTRHLYVHYDERAVQHVFAVACGLDSMVVGEAQILGQVREALKLAQRRGTVGRSLNELVQQALRVGKRARATTAIDRAGATLVSVGLSTAARRIGPLAGRRALVVGAGAISGLAARTLAAEGVAEIVVANRTYQRAARVAAAVTAAPPGSAGSDESAGPGDPGGTGGSGGSGGPPHQAVSARAVSLAQLDAALAEADLVVSCTGATGLVITADMVRAAVPRRVAGADPDAGSTAGGSPGASLFLLDLALPHDVDPAVREVPGVALLDLEGLRTAGDGVGRQADIEAVRRIVAEEVVAFSNAARVALVSPTVVALRSKAAQVVDAELARLAGRLPDVDEAVRGEIAQTVRRVVDKLLHGPTVRVKELAASPGGDTYADALRELFDLDPKAPEAVTQADMTGEGTRPTGSRRDAERTEGDGGVRWGMVSDL